MLNCASIFVKKLLIPLSKWHFVVSYGKNKRKTTKSACDGEQAEE